MRKAYNCCCRPSSGRSYILQQVLLIRSKGLLLSSWLRQKLYPAAGVADQEQEPAAVQDPCSDFCTCYPLPIENCALLEKAAPMPSVFPLRAIILVVGGSPAAFSAEWLQIKEKRSMISLYRSWFRKLYLIRNKGLLLSLRIQQKHYPAAGISDQAQELAAVSDPCKKQEPFSQYDFEMKQIYRI